ncbi:hypothetical protein KKC94_04670 [Patescibacteria group bacterium]|nr:hypothetical protein [Patescibacteria group bacterium]
MDEKLEMLGYSDDAGIALVELVAEQGIDEELMAKIIGMDDDEIYRIANRFRGKAATLLMQYMEYARDLENGFRWSEERLEAYNGDMERCKTLHAAMEKLKVALGPAKKGEAACNAIDSALNDPLWLKMREKSEVPQFRFLAILDWVKKIGLI